MNAKPDIGYGELLKSAFVSLLWALASLALALYLNWDAAQLAKTFYILISYATICLILKWYFWHAFGEEVQTPEPKESGFSVYDLFDTKWELVILPIGISAAAIAGFSKEVSKLTTEWNDADNSLNLFQGLIDVSLENWWLVLLTIGLSIFSFAGDFHLVRSQQVRLEDIKERSSVKLMFLTVGYALLVAVVTAFFDIENQKFLFLLLVILFFLPWDAIFEIIMKTYEEYWKLH